MHPRAHSPMLLSSPRGQAEQENRSPVGPRALASRTPQRRLPFKPGRTHIAEGSHSMSLSLLQVPSLPAFLPEIPPPVPDLLSACLGGTRTSPMPGGNATRSGGTLRWPRPVLLQPQSRSAPPPPLLPLMVLPRAPLLLKITRSLRETWPLALLMQGLPVQDLMKVPRA